MQVKFLNISPSPDAKTTTNFNGSKVNTQNNILKSPQRVINNLKIQNKNEKNFQHL